jgi:hypothetical protein
MNHVLQRQVRGAKHRFTPNEKQFRYVSYDDVNAPGEYWRVINDIAVFIGRGMGTFAADLAVHPTIRVVKAQERNGAVSIACMLAERQMVERKFQLLKKLDLDAFYVECVWEDIRHYRDLYLRAFTVWPQFYDAIRDGSSYQLLLARTKAEFIELFELGYRLSEIDLEKGSNMKIMFDICLF